MTPRESWTDERLDDLAKHMDARFDQVDARFSDLTRLMQIGLGIVGAILTLITGMLAGLITLMVTQL
ncbi:MAG TPA: hypothetical protein VKA35_06985 [Solirubrobacterales bacterium]|nr:hypothetical protein [Solirubrobacterales bacterium]